MSATIDDLAAKLDAILADLARLHGKIDRLADARPAASPARASNGGGAVFPNYGRKKNEPVSGADLGDLEYYAAGCRRTLDDPAKSRWHSKERDLLAAIDAEIARQGGTAPPREEAPPDFGGGGGATDDIPFAPLDGRI